MRGAAATPTLARPLHKTELSDSPDLFRLHKVSLPLIGARVWQARPQVTPLPRRPGSPAPSTGQRQDRLRLSPLPGAFQEIMRTLHLTLRVRPERHAPATPYPSRRLARADTKLVQKQTRAFQAISSDLSGCWPATRETVSEDTTADSSSSDRLRSIPLRLQCLKSPAHPGPAASAPFHYGRPNRRRQPGTIQQAAI